MGEGEKVFQSKAASGVEDPYPPGSSRPPGLHEASAHEVARLEQMYVRELAAYKELSREQI